MGSVALTGHFTPNGSTVPKLALNLAQCEDCGLVQLFNSYSHELLYGENYGYESHLNKSMQSHLINKARILEKRFLPNRSAVVMDIASNDGTLLSGYKGIGITKIGVDPILEFLNDFYPRNTVKIPKFFDQNILDDVKPNSVDLVTSLSVLYDLERPTDFVQTVQRILKPGGVWHFEQSYLPSMLYNLSYDTICHEHLLYLSMRDIQKMLFNNGFSIIDATQNAINGGSLAITAVKEKRNKLNPYVDYLIRKENEMGLLSGEALIDFANASKLHAQEIRSMILEFKNNGFNIHGLGASTKGNVLLNFANITSAEVDFIGDVNPKKFGKRTPGSNIEIISQDDALSVVTEQTIFLILPWHFRDNIISNCSSILERSGKFLLPLPRLEIVAN